MRRFTIILTISVLLAASIAAGCITSPAPTTTPAPTATPVPTVTVPPTATPIGGSDDANIEFHYQIGKASEYDGQKASPGNLFYMLQVRVKSDKPVETSPDWFWVEFKVNDTAAVQDRAPFSTYMFKYPSKVIGPDTGSAKGGLIFELPASLADGYPKPYYYMPMGQQQGQYKVYDKVYGTVGDIQ
jgi:hypothetical protein